jgi:hypothetical protein
MTNTLEPPSGDLLSDVEALLQQKFLTKPAPANRALPSSAQDPQASERIQQLVLPTEQRGRMPYTKDKYLVKENPHLVEWERVVRQFLRELSPQHGHRVSAVMVYEWATGIVVQELIAEGGNPRPDLMKINKILRHYFGKPYMTYIMGRKVPNCYRVRPGYYIKRHRPMTLTLYAEYAAKTLNP